MHIAVITLFPEIFEALQHGIPGRAMRKSLLTLSVFNPRDYAQDVHRTVDDRPYGGGPGMVMQVEPIRAAIAAAKSSLQQDDAPVIYMSPQGVPFTQATAKDSARKRALILLAGRYEGIDERILTHHVDVEWSIGDYVLSGGELPAMVVIDSIARLLPGVLGDAASAEDESFTAGLLEYPHYTRPEHLPEGDVPPVLMSGDHAAIRAWRTEMSLQRTRAKRPDLLESIKK